MGSPCPPSKRLRGANLELLPHVNNLLGSVFGGGEEELMSHSGQEHFGSSHISPDGKRWWGLHPQECKQHNVPDLCYSPRQFERVKLGRCRGISFRGLSHHLNTNIA